MESKGMDNLVTVVEEIKNDQKEFFQTLDLERKTFEEMLAKKADGKDVGELKEQLERVEKAHTDLQEKLTQELADVKMSASSHAPKADSDEVKSAFYEYIRTGDFGSLSEKKQDLLVKETFDYCVKCRVAGVREPSQVKGMLAGSIPNGGLLVVPPVISDGILRIMEDEMALYNLASKTDIATDRYLRNAQLSKASAVWEGEMDAWPETKTLTYGDLEIRVFKITARPIISQDLLEDASINVEAELINSVRSTYMDYISDAAVNGDGNKKPIGFLTYPMEQNNPKTRYWGKMGYVATGQSGAFKTFNKDTGVNPADDLIELIGGLKTGYLNNATWLMNRKTATEIRKWKDASGNYIWEPSLTQGVPGYIFGYRVAYDSNMPNVETADSFPIAFGDFRRGLLFVQRRGMTVIRDVVTKPGQVIFNTSMRIGCGVQDFDAIKFLKAGTA